MHYLFTGTFVHKWSTGHLFTNGSSIRCLFVYIKRLTYISVDRFLSACAQTVERYIGMRRKGNSMKIKKITLYENANSYYRKNASNVQQTVARCFCAHMVTRADLYPFAVQTSVNHFLSARCLLAVQISIHHCT